MVLPGDDERNVSLTTSVLYAQVHKCLLASTSDYFRAMLCGSMRESKENSVELSTVRASSLQTIVDFIYSGEMSLDIDSLVDILNAADHLQVRAALDLCSEFIVSMLTFSNADDLVRIAEMYSLDRVSEFYTLKVLSEFEEFARTPSFLGLTVDTLAAYLSDDRLRVRSEYLLVDAVVRWCAHDISSRTESLPALVRCIRFALMSRAELQSLLSTFGLQTPAIRIVIEAGLEYHHTVSAGKHPSVVDGTTAARTRAPSKSLVLVHQGSSMRPFEIVGFDAATMRFYSLFSNTDGGRDYRVVAAGGFAYVLRVTDSGGGALLNELARFDPRHLSLTMLTPCRRLRLDPAVVAVERQIFVFGGSVDTPSGAAGDTVLSSVERYDIVADAWSDVGTMPTATHAHSALEVDGIVYISGGVVATHVRAVSDQLLRYDPAGGVYAQCAPMHCARRLHAMVSASDNAVLYIVGGIGVHHSFHQQTQIPVERYDIAADQWTVLGSTTLAGRSVGHFLAVDDSSIISVGREHHQATEDDIWRYEVSRDTWSPYVKAPSRMSLASTSCLLMHINFHDEKVSKKLIPERR